MSVVINKHRENRKTLPGEHHIGCQMCRIALSKRTWIVNLKNKSVFYSSYSSDSSDSSEKNNATSLQKKITQPGFFFTFSAVICHI